jgi:UDP-GlcNAc:undecaprenyl-phosphate/decaprenyl-phosphate GlcNAc-1-phosphate transferase
MPIRSLVLFQVLLAFALSLVLTPIVRFIARRWGLVARPKADRWHKKPTAMMGGVAIFLAVLLTHLISISNFNKSTVLIVLATSTFLFIVGLIDDFLHIKPYQKLIGQIIGASVIVYSGLTLPWTDSGPVNMAITIFWLLGITNAINLLDNMDGLAAGISAIAAIFLAFNFFAVNQTTEALMLLTFAAALLGFLVYNSNPASIFMGDCGSMFIGFFLASSALLSAVSASGGRSRTFLPVLAVPILTLFIPIFDTTFVTVLRKLSGRAASQGGRDHTSHRLVALGMSERRAVWMLYGFAGLSGLLALKARDMSLDISLALILGFTILLTLLGVYLAKVKVYDEKDVHTGPINGFLIDFSYKRRIFEVLLDVVLIILSYYTAYTMLYGSVETNSAWLMFKHTVPVLVIIKLATFLIMGVYKGFWRYTSIDDLIVFAKAVIIGSVVSIMTLLFAFRFQGLSRAVFVLDGLLLLMMLAGSRMTFRLFKQLLPVQQSNEGRRVLIYGAGDGGELLLRELINNKELRYSPVGFVDDDPLKKDKVIHGLRVYGGNGALRSICKQHDIEEVLISSSQFSENRIKEILTDCHAENVALKRMHIKIEDVMPGNTVEQ